jgi:hypothetical protein
MMDATTPAPASGTPGLQFGSPARPARIRGASTRTPEQIDAAQLRYMRSPHYQARVALEKDRILQRRQARQENQAAHDAQREARRTARLRANEPDTPQERAFAARGYADFGKDKPTIAAALTATASSLQEAAPHVWANGEPGRYASAAFETIGAYQAGKATNGQLDGALKDLMYASAPTAANRRTGEVTPEREQAVAKWQAVVNQAEKLANVVRSADRERNGQSPAPKGPALGR